MNTQENKKEVGLTAEAEYIKEKRKKAIEYLGERYILHCAHQVQKKEKLNG